MINHHVPQRINEKSLELLIKKTEFQTLLDLSFVNSTMQLVVQTARASFQL